MRGRFATRAEIISRANKALAKQMLPNLVDYDTRREEVLAADQPIG